MTIVAMRRILHWLMMCCTCLYKRHVDFHTWETEVKKNMLKFKENKCRILSFTYIPHYISHTLYCCLIYVYTRTYDETTNGKNIYAYLSNVWGYTSKRISSFFIAWKRRSKRRKKGREEKIWGFSHLYFFSWSFFYGHPMYVDW